MLQPDEGAPFRYLSDQRAAVSSACEGAIKRGVYERALDGVLPLSLVPGW